MSPVELIKEWSQQSRCPEAGPIFELADAILGLPYGGTMVDSLEAFARRSVEVRLGVWAISGGLPVANDSGDWVVDNGEITSGAELRFGERRVQVTLVLIADPHRLVNVCIRSRHTMWWSPYWLAQDIMLIPVRSLLLAGHMSAAKGVIVRHLENITPEFERFRMRFDGENPELYCSYCEDESEYTCERCGRSLCSGCAYEDIDGSGETACDDCESSLNVFEPQEENCDAIENWRRLSELPD